MINLRSKSLNACSKCFLQDTLSFETKFITLSLLSFAVSSEALYHALIH